MAEAMMLSKAIKRKDVQSGHIAAPAPHPQLSIVNCQLSIFPSFATGPSSKQRGFSMIEMLVAAFILAIGILGIVMLQAMSLRAARGGSNMGTAARIAGQIVDEAELQGRLTRLNITDGNHAANNLPPVDLSGFRRQYIKATSDGSDQEETEYFNIKGGDVVSDDPDPTISTPFFTVVTKRTEVMPPAGATVVGRMSDFQVTVTFTDSVDAANRQPIERTFSLTRRIAHG